MEKLNASEFCRLCSPFDPESKFKLQDYPVQFEGKLVIIAESKTNPDIKYYCTITELASI